MSAERQAQFEACLNERDVAGANGAAEWLDGYSSYLRRYVYLPQPDTFTAANASAALPELLQEIAGEQMLVRLETLDYALKDQLAPSIDQLALHLSCYQGKTGTESELAQAGAALETVCLSLNNNPNAVRPRFAAFADDLRDELDKPDWATRLRDRLGLPHYPDSRVSGPHPVALMGYRVSEVLKTGGKTEGVTSPFAVPTVLDADPYEVFHPAPVQADYGRTLDLRGNPDGSQLTAEILHLKMLYQPRHILKVGTICDKSDYLSRLPALRAEHLFCLQYLNDRPDFGTLPA